MIEFVVYGKQITQGSIKTIAVRRTGGAIVTNQRGNPVLATKYDNEAKLIPWRASVADAAGKAMAGQEILTCRVALIALFAMARPKSHYGTGRNAGKLKKSAAEAPTNQLSGDTDKFLRGIGDALEGTVYVNDSQITLVFGCKFYALSGKNETEIMIFTPDDWSELRGKLEWIARQVGKKETECET